jgi:hypothetical protein
MFRKSTAQSSLFEAGLYLKDALPENDWSYIYRDKVLPLIDEDKFKHLYSQEKGRPNSSVKTMISLLIFMGLEKYVWRMVEFQFPRRIDWMIATNAQIGKAFIDHVTLFKFYQRLEKDETAAGLFSTITRKFIELCGASVKKQRTDSFFVHGWLQLLSRYGLFKETIRKFLYILRKQKPGLYEKIKDELSKYYLDKEFDLTEKDNEKARRRVSQMASDMHKIIIAFENHKQIKHYESFKILKQVFEQQCEVKQDSDNQGPKIIIKDKPDKKAINTPHNPQAQYKRKGKQQVTGDVAFVTETCDERNKTQFITDIKLSGISEHDSTQQPKIQERLIANELKPEKQYADAGFVNGKTIKRSEENGIELEGPTSGRSQSFDAYESSERVFDAGEFDMAYDDNSGELVVNKCPDGQNATSQNKSKKTGKLNIHFDREICAACPKQNLCPVKIGKRVATYSVTEEEYIGALRHHKYMKSSEYRKECAIRAGAESLVSEITRAHGMRKSRHRERKRTELQLIFAALACNVKRFIRHWDKYGQSDLKQVCQCA